MRDKEWIRERLQSGRVNERDGDRMYGRMYACSAAHHHGGSLGPMHGERMKDNEWAHETLHNERVNEIDGDGRHGRVERRR